MLTSYERLVTDSDSLSVKDRQLPVIVTGHLHVFAQHDSPIVFGVPLYSKDRLDSGLGHSSSENR
jgi:hypothetical protein